MPRYIIPIHQKTLCLGKSGKQGLMTTATLGVSIVRTAAPTVFLPYDYETRDEYNAVIAHMKVGHTVDTHESEYVPPSKAAPSSNNERYLFLRVSRLGITVRIGIIA